MDTIYEYKERIFRILFVAFILLDLLDVFLLFYYILIYDSFLAWI